MELKNTIAFFETLGSTPGRLLRVEVLLLFSSFVWLLLELFGSDRRRYSHWFFRSLVWAVYTLSTVLPPYTIGLLQAAPFRDQTFVLWGTILLLIQVSVHSLSVYRVHDIGERKRMLVQHLLQIFLVLWLIVNYDGTNRSYSATIWTFWTASVVKVVIMSRFLGKAGNKGGLLEHSKLVADYMFVEHEVADADQDPKKMAGYRYIFHGEEKLASLLPTAPEYRVELKDQVATGNKLTTIDSVDQVATGNKLTTIDSVWRWIKATGNKLTTIDSVDQVATGNKLTTIDSVWRWIDHEYNTEETKENIKDITLSFALFKLLKRRFCGYTLGEADRPKTLKFVLQGLLYERSNYVRAFGVIETELSFMYDFFFTKFDTEFGFIGSFSLVVILVATFYNIISGPFSRGYHRSNLHQKVNDADIIRWVTVVLLAILLIASFIDVAIFPHRWIIVRKLYRETRSGKRTKEIEMSSLDPEKGCWERKLGQYPLLVNFDYHPWNVVSRLTLNLVDAKRDGEKAGRKIELPEEVIIHVLSRFTANNGRLENGQSALAKHGMKSQFSWACALPTDIHKILVWHIATAICADKATMEPLTDDHLVAKSLSDYCAYLVALVPGMLPGHAYDTQRIFDVVVMEARRLAGCPTLSSRCQELMDIQSNGKTILELGGRLGRELMHKVPGEMRRWKMLADFWAEFILFLAPSTNTDIHAEMLASGGEFMTHLWALLSHAGILDRPSSNSETRVDEGGHDATAQDSAVSVNPDHRSSSSSV